MSAPDRIGAYYAENTAENGAPYTAQEWTLEHGHHMGDAGRGEPVRRSRVLRNVDQDA